MNFLKRFFSLLSQDSSCDSLRFQAFEESPIATLVVTKSGEVVEVNKAFTHLMGYDGREVIGSNISLLKSSKHDYNFYKKLWQKLLEEESYRFEIFNKKKSGEVVEILEQVHLVKDEEQYFIVTFEDITEQKSHERRQEYLATHDPLTGLANRALLRDRYNHAIVNAKRQHTKLGVMICDLNEFKQINDRYGHKFGDTVLTEVSQRLKSVVRESDTVARYGGDEFILILEQIGERKAFELQEEISGRLTFDITCQGDSCRISLAIGYACFPSDGTTFEQLVEVADRKMYDAKRKYYGF